LVSIDLTDPASTFVDVIPENDSQVLSSATLVAGSILVVCHSADANHRVSIWDAKSGKKIRDISEDEIPDGVAVKETSARWDDNVLFLGYESFLAPLTILRGIEDREEGIKFEKAIEPSIDGFKSSDYITEQVNGSTSILVDDVSLARPPGFLRKQGRHSRPHVYFASQRRRPVVTGAGLALFLRRVLSKLSHRPPQARLMRQGCYRRLWRHTRACLQSLLRKLHESLSWDVSSAWKRRKSWQ
jgi:hypothetical protein